MQQPCAVAAPVEKAQDDCLSPKDSDRSSTTHLNLPYAFWKNVNRIVHLAHPIKRNCWPPIDPLLLPRYPNTVFSGTSRPTSRKGKGRRRAESPMDEAVDNGRGGVSQGDRGVRQGARAKARGSGQARLLRNRPGHISLRCCTGVEVSADF